MKQTVLGSTGVIGRELAKALTQYTADIRLVSRNPEPVNPTDECVSADLLRADQVHRAVEGSEVVYLVAGLRYSVKTWEVEWPIVMKNVIDACKRHAAKLVFFDNVYAYGKVQGWMTEQTPLQPVSKKGEIRAALDLMLLKEIEAGSLEAQIVRAPDFYGPQTKTSYLSVMVFENLRKGKKAQWMLNPDVKHSFIYTPDAGKATALLGNTGSAFGQVWHLPTDPNALTGRQIIELAAREFGVEPKFTVYGRSALRLIGLFVPPVRENMEMLYQNEFEYLFDSSKFRSSFALAPTSYPEGIRATVRSMRSA